MDGILIILGIDSRHNSEYVKLFNWLFLGYSSILIEEKQVLSSEYNESFFLIRYDGKLELYMEFDGFDKLKHLFFGLPQVNSFVPSEE